MTTDRLAAYRALGARQWAYLLVLSVGIWLGLGLAYPTPTPTPTPHPPPIPPPPPPPRRLRLNPLFFFLRHNFLIFLFFGYNPSFFRCCDLPVCTMRLSVVNSIYGLIFTIGS